MRPLIVRISSCVGRRERRACRRPAASPVSSGFAPCDRQESTCSWVCVLALVGRQQPLRLPGHLVHGEVQQPGGLAPATVVLRTVDVTGARRREYVHGEERRGQARAAQEVVDGQGTCLLYTSDAADE